jgi:Flp pilus assembly protein TadG
MTMTHPLRRDDGIVALEFALVAPIFLLLVMGTMVFALYFGTLVAVVHGATEGARASVRGMTTTERTQLSSARIQKILGNGCIVGGTACSVSYPAAADTTTFKVRVQYDLSTFNFQWFFNLLDFATGMSGSTAPATIGHTVTIGTGGYDRLS